EKSAIVDARTLIPFSSIRKSTPCKSADRRTVSRARRAAREAERTGGVRIDQRCALHARVALPSAHRTNEAKVLWSHACSRRELPPNATRLVGRVLRLSACRHYDRAFRLRCHGGRRAESGADGTVRRGAARSSRAGGRRRVLSEDRASFDAEPR